MADGKSLEVWSEEYATSISDIPSTSGSNVHYNVSADRLRRLVQSGILRLTDLR